MKTPKGTRDLLPLDTALFQEIEQSAISHFGKYGFYEIRTPIFEETALFLRGIGGETDIVTKEMYTFTTKGNSSFTLRPEMTASVCRSVIQHSLVGKEDLIKLMYMGPMFRYERPQAGRYRQFHQLGAEVFGSNDPLVDAETIEALFGFLKPFNLPNLTLSINSVGDQSDRPQYLAYLKEALEGSHDNLCDDCKVRRLKNVLRVLDCKKPNCQAQLDGLKPISEFWSDENRAHFEKVCEYLDIFGIPYQLNHKLVRGLDYYTKTAFELLSGDLGAQSAVMGGGRYDALVEQLGGKETPAFGWAMGMDRLATLIQQNREVKLKGADIFFVFAQKAWLAEALPLMQQLREAGFAVGYDIRMGSFKSQIRRANREGARFTAIIGDDEKANQTVMLKDMVKSEQSAVAVDQLIQKLKEVQNA